MMLRVSTAGTILSSAMVAAVPNTVSSMPSIQIATITGANKPEAIVSCFQMEPVVPDRRIKPLVVNHWSSEKDTRFRELVRKEALQEVSVEESAELEVLTRLRRAEKYPRSADEILWQRRQQSLTRDLVQALQAYVEFHETPRNT